MREANAALLAAATTASKTLKAKKRKTVATIISIILRPSSLLIICSLKILNLIIVYRHSEKLSLMQKAQIPASDGLSKEKGEKSCQREKGAKRNLIKPPLSF
jgi:hypothetical protein